VTSGAQSAQLLIDGEVDLGSVWNGRIYKPIKDGAKIDYTYDQCLYTSDCMIVPKGSPHKKEAMEFIANMVKARTRRFSRGTSRMGRPTRRRLTCSTRRRRSYFRILPQCKNRGHARLHLLGRKRPADPRSL